MEKYNLNVNLIFCCIIDRSDTSVRSRLIHPLPFQVSVRSIGKPEMQVPEQGFKVLLFPSIMEEERYSYIEDICRSRLYKYFLPSSFFKSTHQPPETSDILSSVQVFPIFQYFLSGLGFSFWRTSGKCSLRKLL